jgi:hypothetical protein
MLKVEPVEAAVQRSLTTMMEWGDVSQAQFQHYFLYVNINRAVHHIKNGDISCWVLLNCISGKEMLSKFNDEQLEMISAVLEVPYWIKKFRDNPSDVVLVKEIFKEAGIE